MSRTLSPPAVACPHTAHAHAHAPRAPRALLVTRITPASPPQPLPDVKATVEKVIIDAGYQDKRPSKLDIDDFLALLSAMNSAGIHFAA